eukprot:jgi/Botrbrau1/14487/Bobra.0014s0121.1
MEEEEPGEAGQVGVHEEAEGPLGGARERSRGPEEGSPVGKAGRKPRRKETPREIGPTSIGDFGHGELVPFNSLEAEVDVEAAAEEGASGTSEKSKRKVPTVPQTPSSTVESSETSSRAESPKSPGGPPAETLEGAELVRALREEESSNAPPGDGFGGHREMGPGRAVPAGEAPARGTQRRRSSGGRALERDRREAGVEKRVAAVSLAAGLVTVGAEEFATELADVATELDPRALTVDDFLELPRESLEEGLKVRGLWRSKLSKARMAELMHEAFMAEQDEIESEGSEEHLELLMEAENPSVSRGAGLVWPDEEMADPGQAREAFAGRMPGERGRQKSLDERGQQDSRRLGEEVDVEDDEEWEFEEAYYMKNAEGEYVHDLDYYNDYDDAPDTDQEEEEAQEGEREQMEPQLEGQPRRPKGLLQPAIVWDEEGNVVQGQFWNPDSDAERLEDIGTPAARRAFEDMSDHLHMLYPPVGDLGGSENSKVAAPGSGARRSRKWVPPRSVDPFDQDEDVSADADDDLRRKLEDYSSSRQLPKGFDSVAAEPSDGRPTLPENEVADGFLLESGRDLDRVSEFDADGQAELNMARQKGRMRAAGYNNGEERDGPEGPRVHRSYYDLPDRSPEAEEEDLFPLGVPPEGSAGEVPPKGARRKGAGAQESAPGGRKPHKGWVTSNVQGSIDLVTAEAWLDSFQQGDAASPDQENGGVVVTEAVAVETGKPKKPRGKKAAAAAAGAGAEVQAGEAGETGSPPGDDEEGDAGSAAARRRKRSPRGPKGFSGAPEGPGPIGSPGEAPQVDAGPQDGQPNAQLNGGGPEGVNAMLPATTEGAVQVPGDLISSRDASPEGPVQVQSDLVSSRDASPGAVRLPGDLVRSRDASLEGATRAASSPSKRKGGQPGKARRFLVIKKEGQAAGQSSATGELVSATEVLPVPSTHRGSIPANIPTSDMLDIFSVPTAAAAVADSALPDLASGPRGSRGGSFQDKGLPNLPNQDKAGVGSVAKLVPEVAPRDFAALPVQAALPAQVAVGQATMPSKGYAPAAFGAAGGADLAGLPEQAHVGVPSAPPSGTADLAAKPGPATPPVPEQAQAGMSETPESGSARRVRALNAAVALLKDASLPDQASHGTPAARPRGPADLAEKREAAHLGPTCEKSPDTGAALRHAAPLPDQARAGVAAVLDQAGRGMLEDAATLPDQASAGVARVLDPTAGGSLEDAASLRDQASAGVAAALDQKVGGAPVNTTPLPDQASAGVAEVLCPTAGERKSEPQSADIGRGCPPEQQRKAATSHAEKRAVTAPPDADHALTGSAATEIRGEAKLGEAKLGEAKLEEAKMGEAERGEADQAPAFSPAANQEPNQELLQTAKNGSDADSPPAGGPGRQAPARGPGGDAVARTAGGDAGSAAAGAAPGRAREPLSPDDQPPPVPWTLLEGLRSDQRQLEGLRRQLEAKRGEVLRLQRQVLSNEVASQDNRLLIAGLQEALQDVRGRLAAQRAPQGRLGTEGEGLAAERVRKEEADLAAELAARDAQLNKLLAQLGPLADLEPEVLQQLAPPVVPQGGAAPLRDSSSPPASQEGIAQAPSGAGAVRMITGGTDDGSTVTADSLGVPALPQSIKGGGTMPDGAEDAGTQPKGFNDAGALPRSVAAEGGPSSPAENSTGSTEAPRPRTSQAMQPGVLVAAGLWWLGSVFFGGGKRPDVRADADEKSTLDGPNSPENSPGKSPPG